MKLQNLRLPQWQMSFLPFVFLLFAGSFTYMSCPSGKTPSGLDIAMERDTLEPGMVIDTFITFDPVTFKEEIQIVVRKEGEDEPQSIQTTTYEPEGIDTFIIFSPETLKEEMMIIINHETGERDTIRY